MSQESKSKIRSWAKRFAIGLLALVAILVGLTLIWHTTLTPGASSNSLAITNVSIVNPELDTLLTGQTVLIDQGRVVQVAATAELTLPANSTQVDGSGKFLIPGLWDMHVHFTGRAAQLTMPLFIANGVLNVREMGGMASFDKKKKWREQIAAGALLGPRVMAQAGAIANGLATEEDARGLVASTQAEFIKTFDYLLPEPYYALLAEAKKQGISVVGHRPRPIKAIDAARAGHRSFEHARLFLFEAFPGADALRERYRARYSGEDASRTQIETTALLREMIDTHSEDQFHELVRVMVENETWFCPTHLTRKMDAFADNEAYRNDPRLRYVHAMQRTYWAEDADGMVSRDPSPEGRKTYMDFYLKGLELTGKAHQAGVKIIAGTDANDTYVIPGFSLHDELQELVKAGLTPMEALQTATVNPATYFGLSSDYGAISAGKKADMILLDANPLEEISNTTKISAVIYNGALYTREDLDDLLAYVEQKLSWAYWGF